MNQRRCDNVDRSYVLRPGCFLCILIFSALNFAHAQDVGVGMSTIHDENIFDVHTPTSDQITQFQLDAFKDWDFDNTSFTLGYTGSLLLFRDLVSRNYHNHLVSAHTTFQFYSDDEEPDSAEADQDSAETPHTPTPVVHADSLDRFFYLSAAGASQFDKEDFAQFDNTLVSANATLRQPIGMFFSLRPSYTFTYHSYPNLAGITNVEHDIGLMLGTNIISHGWITLAGNYGLKDYSASTYTYTYTVGTGNQSGHGKGGAGGNKGQRTQTITLTTPSVHQILTSVDWHQVIETNTELTTGFLYFGNPSAIARLLPEQISNVVERQATFTPPSSENEIFDDHYGYSGEEYQLGIQQSLPFSFVATARERFIHKFYTLSATQFDSTATASGNRIDSRSETDVNLSRPIPIHDGKILRAQIDWQYIHNTSNAPYYEFDKNTLTVGLEFTF